MTVRLILPRFDVCIVSTLVLCTTIPACAGENSSFLIPPRDGYGISECLAEDGSCGRVVADSWCESHGLSKASSYGLIDDVTAAIPTAPNTAIPPSPLGKAEPGSYVINCQP